MPKLRVTVIDEVKNRRLKVDLPDDAVVEKLLPALANKLGLPPADYQLTHEPTGRALGGGQTLASFGVGEGDALRLAAAREEAPVAPWSAEEEAVPIWQKVPVWGWGAIVGVVLLVAVVGAFLAGRGAKPAPTPTTVVEAMTLDATSTAVPRPTATPVAPTAYPTYTLYPTYTPAPTDTPVPSKQTPLLPSDTPTTEPPMVTPTAQPQTLAPTAVPTVPPAEKKRLIVVGSKEFTEQLILGQITVLALQDAGYEVDDQTNLGGTAVNREALLAGETDMYWEYTGTAWMVHLGHEESITNSQECYDKVKTEDAENGLVWLAMAPFNNTYTLMMKQETVSELGIKSISDLAAHINGGGDARLCTDQEFYNRPDGFKGVEALYGFQLNEDQVVMVDFGLSYKALQDDQCTTAMGFATDGHIPAFGFFNLEDDKQFFPVYNPAPVVRKEVLDANPGIADVLNPIAQALTTEKMMELNKRADIDGRDPKDVACDFLKSGGFVDSCP